MLKHYHATLSSPSLSPPISHNLNYYSNFTLTHHHFYPAKPPVVAGQTLQVFGTRCQARQRVRYEEDEEEEEEYGHNEEIGMLELYSQFAKEEALLVKALVDEREVELLIFKGFSSSLSHGTSPDPTRSIIPARAVIKCIDRVKGPFNPSNIEYIEKGLTLEAFKIVVQKIEALRPRA